MIYDFPLLARIHLFEHMEILKLINFVVWLKLEPEVKRVRLRLRSRPMERGIQVTYCTFGSGQLEKKTTATSEDPRAKCILHVLFMVLILDGFTQNMMRMHERK